MCSSDLNLVGSNVGVAVGRTVGSDVGNLVGSNVGVAVGRAVGSDVGNLVGSNVGVAVGRVVGSDVGSLVGPIVGDAVGRAVGDAVGASDGSDQVVFIIKFISSLAFSDPNPVTGSQPEAQKKPVLQQFTGADVQLLLPDVTSFTNRS